jgi:dihydrofolate synthase/folylpolyglutamate synthase
MKHYQETLDYIFSKLPMYQREGKSAFKKDLTNIIALCDHLGQPQHTFKSIHIAGTNGKGSCTHIIAAVLQTAGYKVGVYTSPHYKDFRERIKINGVYISEQAVIDFVSNLEGFIEEQQPSFFEITVGMAFDYFSKEKVDIAVVETGLGGRLDSTNIITPELSVITNIGFDHVEMLGDTLAKIAFEKAGIIKDKTPVIIGEKHPETIPVFEAKAAEMDASLSYAEDLFQLELFDQQLSADLYQLNKNDWGIEQLKFDLKGPFQIKNLTTALAAIKNLQALGFQIQSKDIIEACSSVRKRTKMMGRWEVLQQEAPLIIADSAHNAEGLDYALKAIKQLQKGNLHLILGMVNDKNPDKLLKLLPKNAQYYFAKADIPRGLAAEQLLNFAQSYNLKGKAYASVADAFNAAKENAAPNDLIFVGGSIFVVAEVL